MVYYKGCDVNPSHVFLGYFLSLYNINDNIIFVSRFVCLCAQTFFG